MCNTNSTTSTTTDAASVAASVAFNLQSMLQGECCDFLMDCIPKLLHAAEVAPQDATAGQLYGSAGFGEFYLFPKNILPEWVLQNLEYSHSFRSYDNAWDFGVLLSIRPTRWRLLLCSVGDSVQVDIGGGGNSLISAMFNLPREYLHDIPAASLFRDMPHLDGQNIKYAQKPADRANDAKFVSTKPGRYIRRVRPDLTDNQVKDLAAVVAAVTTPFELHFTEPGDRTAVRRIYEKGPQSCMSGKGNHQHGDIRVCGEMVHPAEVYAHPDNNLSLAYMLNGEGKPVARCWVNTDNMKYSSVYSSSDTYRNLESNMEEALKRAGYHYGSEQVMQGERLLRIDTDCGAIVCPYIDPCNMGVEVHDDYLIADGPHEANYETGCLIDWDTAYDMMTCEHCDARVHEDDITYSEHLDMHICNSCISWSFTHGIVSMHRGIPNTDYMHEADAMPLLRGYQGYSCVFRDCSDFVEVTAGLGAGEYIHIDEAITDAAGDVWDSETLEEQGYRQCHECCDVVLLEDYNENEYLCLSCCQEESQDD